MTARFFGLSHLRSRRAASAAIDVGEGLLIFVGGSIAAAIVAVIGLYILIGG